MRVYWRLVLGLVLTLFVSFAFVKPPTWVQEYTLFFWIGLPLVIALWLFAELWPSREARLQRQTQRLLTRRKAGMPRMDVDAYWGTAPAASTLVGRDRDMTDLQNCLEAECRAVGVFGAPGVGKSSLVANVTREYAALFDQVLWHSLQAAPPAREILDRWLAALGITPQTDRLSERLDLLIAFLARKRCLIVLDNAETVFDDSRAPQKPVDVDYSELLQRILTNPGRSTLIVTS